MKVKEIFTKKDDDLRRDLDTLYNKLSKIRFDIVTKQGKNVALVKEIKKDIARIKTILREREIFKEEQDEKKN